MSKLDDIAEMFPPHRRWKATSDFDGSDWLVAHLGEDPDGLKWDVTTDGLRASDNIWYADDDAKAIAAAPGAIAYLMKIARLTKAYLAADIAYQDGLDGTINDTVLAEVRFVAYDRLRAALAEGGDDVK